MVNSTTVEVTWNPPSITNGILRYYTVVYRSNDYKEMMEVNITVRKDSRIDNVCNCRERHFNCSSGDDQTIVVLVDNFQNVTVLVSGLDPFTSYTFYVLAVTVTPSEPSDNVTVLTDEAGKQVVVQSIIV